MPLVVPGLTSSSDDKNSQWMGQLAGKKLGESSNETVNTPSSLSTSLRIANWESHSYSEPKTVLTAWKQTFAKSELPKEHRVVKDGDMMTADHKPER